MVNKLRKSVLSLALLFSLTSCIETKETEKEPQEEEEVQDTELDDSTKEVVYSFAGGMTYSSSTVPIYESVLLNLYSDNTFKTYCGYKHEILTKQKTFWGTYVLTWADDNETGYQIGDLTLTYDKDGLTEAIHTTIKKEEEIKIRTYEKPSKVSTYPCFNYFFRAELPLDLNVFANDYTSDEDKGIYLYMVPTFKPDRDALSLYVGSNVKSMGGYSYVLQLNRDNTFDVSFWWMTVSTTISGTYSFTDDNTKLQVTYDIIDGSKNEIYQANYTNTYDVVSYSDVIQFALSVSLSGICMPGSAVNMVKVYLNQ